jgi:cell division septal protein FtsQ
MKKFYRILLLLLSFIFLTTYNPIEFSNYKKKNFFFRIKNIEVINNKIIKDKDIIDILGDIIDKNIFFIEKKDIEEPLKKIEFLGKIDVKKRYPNTLIVKVYETKPIAIVFKNNNKYLLDNLSNLIPYKQISNDYHPTIFGKNAEDNFADFFKKINKSIFPHKVVKNYYYFQIGRWDLQLLNDKIIKLPANKINEAFQLAAELLENENFKSYNVIDLRMDGKVIVE